MSVYTRFKDELMDALKVIADKRMEKTLNSVIKEDNEYRKMEEATMAIENSYNSLEIDPDIKAITDNLLAERDGLNFEKVSLAYWARMMDAVLILREMGVRGGKIGR